LTGAQLKQAREQLGLTQAELAKAVGFKHTSTIGRYEMSKEHGRFPVPRWLSLVVRLWLERQRDRPSGGAL
jgi:transcriptional regulator with XRE-family HTH domain